MLAGLGGGYLLLAASQCLELWEINRLEPAASRAPIEATIVGSVLLAVGAVLFARALPFRRSATAAWPAFRLLAISEGLLAVGQLAVAWSEARTALPTALVVALVLSAAGYGAVAAGWWAWSRAASVQRARSAGLRRDWPIRRRVTQVALASGYALFALAEVLAAQRHQHADTTYQFGTLSRAVGFGVASIGHWQLVAALAWLTTAQAARTGMALLGVAACVLAVAPYLTMPMPQAAVDVQAVAYLAVAAGWLGWAAAGTRARSGGG